MRTFTLTLLLSFGISSVTFAQAIDSTQWPFGGPVSISMNLRGTIHFSFHSFFGPGDVDTVYQGAEAYPTDGDPGSSGQPFTWHDVIARSGNHWQLSKSIGASNTTLDLTLDTFAHIIDTLDFESNDSWNSITATTAGVELLDLRYSGDSIWFPSDNWREHFVAAGYSMNGSYGIADTNRESESIDVTSIILRGGSMIRAFDVPHQVDFDPVPIGSSHDSLIVSPFLVFAYGMQLHITHFELRGSDSGFSFVDTSQSSIIPSAAMSVAFHPSAAKSYSDTIMLTSNEVVPNQYYMILSGLGISGANVASSEALISLPLVEQYGDRLFVSNTANLFSLRIFNILGKQLISELNYGALDLDLTSLPQGVYFAEVTAGNQGLLRKFVR